jgi:hypothetical protein
MVRIGKMSRPQNSEIVYQTIASHVNCEIAPIFQVWRAGAVRIVKLHIERGPRLMSLRQFSREVSIHYEKCGFSLLTGAGSGIIIGPLLR